MANETTYTYTPADSQVRPPVGRAEALLWVSRSWTQADKVLAEAEANAKTRADYKFVLRGMFSSLTVQAST